MNLPVIDPSPLETLPELGETFGVKILVKRDDLLPLSGGGNKVRKNLRILRAELAKSDIDWVVTCGGLQSNHARVVALLAARLGINCHLVLHSTKPESERDKGNYLLSKLSGARISIVPPAGIADEICRVVGSLSGQGARVLEIPGGAHCYAGALAYVDAVDELDCQLRARELPPPDRIVVPVGTGATHAGLVAGTVMKGWATRVTGVSVARTRSRAWDVLMPLAAELDITKAQLKNQAEICDEWVSGGYEMYGDEVVATVRSAASSHGLILDPTYTAKAFLGMTSMLATGEIERGSSVLFWHTGGLLNLLASEMRS